MKHARKFVLVDYEKYIQNQDQVHELNVNPKPLHNLNSEIRNILQRDDLSDYEKQKLYTSKLRKYLFFVNQKQKLNQTALNHDADFSIKKEEDEEKPKFTIKKRKLEFSDSESESNWGDSDTSNEIFFEVPQKISFVKSIASTPKTAKTSGKEKSPTPSTSHQGDQTLISHQEKNITPKQKFDLKKALLDFKSGKILTPKQKKDLVSKGYIRKSPMQLRKPKKDLIGGWISFDNILKLKNDK
jgi:hypothetical protein